MKFFLGAHDPTWIGRSTAPLFVSIARGLRKFGRRPALNGWALDSGGFTQVTKHGGWTMEPEQYLDLVYAAGDKCPGLLWASPQDWMVEPAAIAATGLSVEAHQRLTIENYLALKELDERDLIIPVLQGWHAGDHERHVLDYRAHGIELRNVDLVGVGSVCRRQASPEIEGIIRSLRSEGLSLHGFGVKAQGLTRYRDQLTSCDSMAWSYYGRMESTRRGTRMCKTGTHASCTECFEWAHMWYDKHK